MSSIISNEFNWPIFCDTELDIGYLPIPKAANTSIMNALFHLKPERIQKDRLNNIPKEIIDVSLSNPARVHLYSKYMFDNIINKSKVDKQFIFTCVRNPISRFVSFYRDKILRWDPYIHDKMVSLNFQKDMTVDECIENLLSIQDKTSLDQHIIPMSVLLYHKNKLIPDYIMKMESLNRDFEYLNKLLNTDMELSFENSSDNQKVKKIILNSEQEQKLEQYYEDDMFLFNFTNK